MASKNVSNSSLQNLQLNTNKAGMEGINVVKINEIIKKASEGSKFYLHKKKCQERIDVKINQMKANAEQYSDHDILKAELDMDTLTQELELARDLTQTIIHIDMDMFYAAVEMRDDPSLQDKPMAVGSNSMLSTSNYAARKFGVRAAMPGFIGKKLCPDLVIVPTNFDKYRKISGEMHEIFKIYDPNFSPMSLDEAYLNITNYLRKYKDDHEFDDESERINGIIGPNETLAEIVVEEIRQKIKDKTQLTASAGIASNTLLSKVCSDMNKPNGQCYLPPDKEEITKFMEKLPVRKVCGIGNVTEQLLKSLGVITCSDLWKKRGLLRLLFSELSFEHFLSISLGLGSTQISASDDKDRKSISTETTFQGTSDREKLLQLCSDLCHELCEDMTKKNLCGKVFSLKIKTTQFEVRTRAQTLMEPSRNLSILSSVCRKLLIKEMENEPKDRPLSIRLLGVRMSNFVDKCDYKKQTTIRDLFSRTKDSTTGGNHNPPPGQHQESETSHQDICTSLISGITRKHNASVSSNDEIEIVLDKALVPQEEEEVLESTSTKGTEVYTCPICSSKSFTDLGLLNRHMDECLNQGLVKQLVKESNHLHPATSINSSSSSSSSGSNSKQLTTGKRKNNVGSSSDSKRTKHSSNILTKFLGLK